MNEWKQESTEVLFHRLWIKAVGTPTYEKEQWIELEIRLRQLMTSAPDRKTVAASALAQIGLDDFVSFNYDSVHYEGQVKKINRTTATVQITKILGTPRRALFVGSTVRVGASLLAKAQAAAGA
jgi:hypothetical protein